MTEMEIKLDLREKYTDVRKLLEEECKNDPETEPYKSKYKAKAILLEMKDIISNAMDSLSSDDPQLASYKAMKSVTLYQIGRICVDTEEVSAGEKFFTECFESIADHLSPDLVLVSIQVRNQMGVLWCQRNELTQAQTWLNGAEELYKDYKSVSSNKTPKLFHEHFMEDTKSKGEAELEIDHALTKFYLAQVYSALKDFLKSSICCHETLRSQILYNEYDPIEWALNSATLSQFFLEKFLFKQARHHLAAASSILDTYEKTVNEMTGSEEEIEAKKEELRHRSADVSRCWAKYGLFILDHSKNLLSDPEEIVNKEENKDLEELWFENLNLCHYENQITDTEVVSFDDAREVFLTTQKHLNKAKEYYTLEDRASDHVQIVQDHSQLFRHLMAFEQDKERQCKMMKKRIDMLERVLKELNPKYYLSICRQLWYELGEVYHDIMHIKLQKVKDSNEVPSPQALQKINSLTESSIMNFNSFIDSVKDKTKEELPETLPDDLIGPTLVAHFYLGRLCYKYITQDKRKQVENITKSYECFKYLADYCEKDEKARTLVADELSVSKEMMTLLQMKILQY